VVVVEKNDLKKAVESRNERIVTSVNPYLPAENISMRVTATVPKDGTTETRLLVATVTGRL